MVRVTSDVNSKISNRVTPKMVVKRKKTQTRGKKEKKYKPIRGARMKKIENELI